MEVIFPEPSHLQVGERIIPLPEVDFSRIDPRTIYKFTGEKWEKWQRYDSKTGKFYKMVFVAAGRPPTVEISGIKMHVTKEGDPLLDTRRKLKTLGKIYGRILDTCMGLGYTAIACAEITGVEKVIVCEADFNMLQLCRENPWSRELFTNEKIQPLLLPAEQLLPGVPADYFQCVIHDPPRFALAPQLYAPEFYREIFRVLKPGGKLYHYTGDPNRAVRQRSLAARTKTRLMQVGFRRVKLGYMGIVAMK